MITARAFTGKRYAALGLARSGRATVEALLASGAQVLAWDAREEARQGLNGATIGDPLEADLTGFDGVVVSPGVPINTHPIKPYADRFGVPVIGDVELFALACPELPPHKVVGITGTNGKSTTTALIHHILKTAGVPSTMGGNIGLPILAQEPLSENGVYVLELSSFQIDLTYSLDCDVAVLLNVTPDHLDRYESFEAYAAAKARLFEMQSPAGKAVLGIATPASAAIARQLADRGRMPDRVAAGSCMDQSRWPALQGQHNGENALAGRAVCRWLGLGDDAIDRGLESFAGLPNRMELVVSSGGIAYVNDSKGTNTAASAPALAAFDNIHWIVGGLAKETGLSECEAELGRVKAAYTIGEAGPAFADLLERHMPVERCDTLDRAVASAVAAAMPGDTVLLSPACASFDQYRDFEHRGDHFRELVRSNVGKIKAGDDTLAEGRA
jgi:UDP-N-acetylmuramoylalanine--D-glutamate ligase